MSPDHDQMSVGIVDSFVFRTNKLLESQGAGEAKLHIGPASSAGTFNRFFEGFPCRCTFNKQNLRDYLFSVRFEYEHQLINRYKDVSRERWLEHLEQIRGFDHEDLQFTLERHTDGSRYYVRSHDTIFSQFLRKLALPYVSSLIFKWSEQASGDRILLARLELAQNPLSGVEISHSVSGAVEVLSPQVIYFGPPGTGKSLAVKRLVESQAAGSEDVMRTAFHPDTDYATFVGSYRPIVEVDDVGESGVSYAFVPGPFTEAYLRAHQTETVVFLVIEEINRARASAVFGNLLPLLDRLPSGDSEYYVDAEPELRDYLREHGLGEAAERLKLPPNLKLLATLNTSDQSLFPMDSAFRRRWSWEYLPVNLADAADVSIQLGEERYAWADFLRVVNAVILDVTGSEDKQLGNRFVSAHDGTIPEEVFVNKVLAFLWYDVFRHEDPNSPGYLFAKDTENGSTPFSYSELFSDEERRVALLQGLLSRLNVEPLSDPYRLDPENSQVEQRVAEGEETMPSE